MNASISDGVSQWAPPLDPAVPTNCLCLHCKISVHSCDNIQSYLLHCHRRLVPFGFDFVIPHHLNHCHVLNAFEHSEQVFNNTLNPSLVQWPQQPQPSSSDLWAVLLVWISITIPYYPSKNHKIQKLKSTYSQMSGVSPIIYLWPDLLFLPLVMKFMSKFWYVVCGPLHS